MTEQQDPFLAALHDMRLRFRAGVPERLEHIRNAWQQLEASPDAREARDALFLVLHQLAGSAGTFGFHALSDAAQAALHQLRKPEQASPQGLQLAVQTLLTTPIEPVDADAAAWPHSA